VVGALRRERLQHVFRVALDRGQKCFRGAGRFASPLFPVRSVPTSTCSKRGEFRLAEPNLRTEFLMVSALLNSREAARLAARNLFHLLHASTSLLKAFCSYRTDYQSSLIALSTFFSPGSSSFIPLR